MTSLHTVPDVARVACTGLVVADSFISPLPAIPPAGALVGVTEILHTPGGCAVNTATALVKLGVTTRLSGCVGADRPGAALRESLTRTGIDAGFMRSVAEQATSQTVILSIDGEDRRYFHVIGANAALTAVDIASPLAGIDVLVVGGYLALPSLDPHALADVLADARAGGIRVVLDVVVPAGLADPAAALAPVLPHVDWFVPNVDEAYAITGLARPQDQANAFLDAGCGAVVITLGADGALYADRDRMLLISPLAVEPVDGSGAGDSATAGLVLGILEGLPIEDILRLAAAVGASATRGLGCTTTVFTQEEALAALSRVTIQPLT